MQGVDVRMNYDSMAKMETTFKKANDQIQTSIGEMNKLAKTLEDGALLGLAGTAFSAAIKEKLVTRMRVLAEKMAELQKDINGAVVATRDGVSTAQSRFK
jgi:uncharacterized protein YukE